MALIGSALLLTMTTASASALRLKTPIIIELFTSQGCSSCPPADKFVTEMSRDKGYKDVLVLGFHVDYWDYLGWKDPYSSKVFSDRQRAYARRTGRSTIYTPQIIVQGRDFLVGSNRRMVNASIASVRESKRKNLMRIIGSENNLGEALVEFPNAIGARSVSIVKYHSGDIVSHIERGENAGATVTYTNVVTELRQHSDLSPGRYRIADLYELDRVASDECLVLIVHAAVVGPIDSAVVLPYGRCS